MIKVKFGTAYATSKADLTETALSLGSIVVYAMKSGSCTKVESTSTGYKVVRYSTLNGVSVETFTSLKDLKKNITINTSYYV